MNNIEYPDNLMEAISLRFPQDPGLSVLASPILDLTSELYPEEMQAITDARSQRRQEFATGRHLARQAMSGLGLEAVPIPRASGREPRWPPTIVGSITHADRWAVASIARADVMKSVGVDLELTGRVGERLHRKLFTDRELELIAAGGPQLAAVMFSAKEAGYKATYPLTGHFIGFREAEVEVDPGQGRFRFRYVGKHAENRVMETGLGWYLFSGPYVLSLVIIPHDG